MRKNTTNHILLAVIAVLLIIIAVLLALLLWPDAPANGADATQTPATTQTPETTHIPETTSKPEETPTEGDTEPETTGVALDVKYMELSYPAELADMVRVTYEDLPDGQSIIFTTAFTGEELELFRFSVSKSGGNGHQLGTLTDEAAGALQVFVDVKEYGSGNWAPADYAKLNELQSRVNDLISQFYDDPRFVPADS